MRLRNSDKSSIWLIPTLLLPQLKNKYNAHFFSKLENFFTSIEIKTYTINKIKNSEIVDIFNLDADKDCVRAGSSPFSLRGWGGRGLEGKALLPGNVYSLASGQESKLKSRQFGFNIANKFGLALKQAILYIDLNVKSWVNPLK